MIEVDLDEQRSVVIVVDGVGVRTVLSIGHADGIDLLRQLQNYFGTLELNLPENQDKDMVPRKGFFERILKRWGRG